MRKLLLSLGLMLALGLAGCVGEKPEAEPTTVPPATLQPETPPPTPEPELATIESDVEELEEFLAELEAEEPLDISEILDFQ